MKRRSRIATVFVTAIAGMLTTVAVARADFGIVPGSVAAVAENSDGTIDTQASSHPYSYTVSFKLNLNAEGATEGGELRDVIVKLPPGLVGNALAVPRCTRQDFDGGKPKCSPSTQIGVLHAVLAFGEVGGPVYNIVPPPGVAAELGFSVLGLNALPSASVGPADGYSVAVTTSDLPIEVRGVSLTIWGVPADPSHDTQRGAEAIAGGSPVSTDAPLLPYLTLPATCAAPLSVTVEVDSTLAVGRFVSETSQSSDAGGSPAALTSCESVPFAPQISSLPTSGSAEAASGLDFELRLPDEGLLNPGGISETEPEKVEVALPEGMTANPSAGEGLGACTEAQYRAETLESGAGEGCPESSKIGSIVAHSPLLEEPVEGSLYLAKPFENPAGSLIGLYIVAKAGERGVLIKQFGKVQPDPNTGQLITTFEGLPPLPYSDFKLQFREGARGLLVDPPACGTYPTVAKLTPFSTPNSPYTVTAYFHVDHGVEGGVCPPGGTPPFHPAAVAGTQNNAASSYSPLYLRVERKDGEQEITGFSTQLPPGLTGNLTGIPLCSETEIQQAQQQTGSEAESNPMCPAASQIGHTIADAGVGSVLAQTPGRLYLGGPFQGAPFSVIDVTSAKVGPFDLGTVVVHLPLDIDPVTAQVSIPAGSADQIPHIIKGIVIHLRDIRVYVDRERFMINPTNCDPLSIGVTAIGSGADFASAADDQAASVTNRFQAADCANLAFKPSFKVSTSGKTSRRDGASLNVKLSYPKDALGKDANIRSVKVDLPKQLPSRLTTLQKACTAHQFEANPAGCPAGSRVGTARALTPILPVALEGPAYFVSHGGAKFPELVIVLQGDGVTIDLHGETFINEHTNVTSSTFRAVPDQPVTSFELSLPQGPGSALAAIGKLCGIKLQMPTSFTAQNGAVIKQNTPITVTGCAKKKTKHKVSKKARGQGGRAAKKG